MNYGIAYSYTIKLKLQIKKLQSNTTNSTHYTHNLYLSN